MTPPRLEKLAAAGRYAEIGATIGYDALRIAMGGQPRTHDVETICRWLRAVSVVMGDAVAPPASPRSSQKEQDHA